MSLFLRFVFCDKNFSTLLIFMRMSVLPECVCLVTEETKRSIKSFGLEFHMVMSCYVDGCFLFRMFSLKELTQRLNMNYKYLVDSLGLLAANSYT